MKIIDVKIQDRNSILGDFKWSSKKQINIFIGENGSGKSTLLKNLAEIFLSANQYFVKNDKEFSIPNFDFQISYEIIIPNKVESFEFESNYVTVNLIGNSKIKDYFSMTTSNTKYTIDDIIKHFGYIAILPSNIITYYAGWDTSLEDLFSNIEDDYKSTMLRFGTNKNKGYSVVDNLPIINIENIHFKILLACVFSFEYNDSLDKTLLTKLNIDKSIGREIIVYLIIEKPKELFYKEKADTFWGAKGELRKFLDIIREISSTEEGNGNDKINFTFQIQDWIRLREFYGTEKRLYFLFHLLNSAEFVADIVSGFAKDGIFQLDKQLSEGEQQLLTFVAIREILLEQNSLLLLDEPDTFLHPTWQQNFIEELKENMEYPKGGDFLPFHNEPNFFITSHSLNLLNNANSDYSSVSLMENGRISNDELHYYGRTISSINYDLMGLNERPEEIQKSLNKLFKLLELEKIEGAQSLFDELSKQLGSDDLDLKQAENEIDFLKSQLNDNDK